MKDKVESNDYMLFSDFHSLYIECDISFFQKYEIKIDRKNRANMVLGLMMSKIKPFDVERVCKQWTFNATSLENCQIAMECLSPFSILGLAPPHHTDVV